METETNVHNVHVWAGSIVTIIQPNIDGNMLTRGTPMKVAINYDEQNDRYRLECDDLTANVSVEYFPTLSLALMRLALIARCAETNWELNMYYNAEGDHFIDGAEGFIQEQTS